MNPANIATAQQIFRQDLAKKLFENEAFLLASQDWTASAVGNKVVWQEDETEPDVVINNATQSLAAADRIDVSASFSLAEYQTRPTRLQFTEEILVNYDKRSSILEGHIKAIQKNMALRILYGWVQGAATNGRIYKTTGASRPAKAPGATGTRKAITYADIISLQKSIIKDEVTWEAGKMNLLIPVELMEELMNLAEFKSRDFYPLGNSSVAQQGIVAVGTIAGCNVYVRSKTLVTNSATTPVLQNPKADDTYSFRTPAATDCLTCVMWHSDYVVRAANFNKLGTDKRTSLVNIVPYHGGLEFSVTAVAGGASFYKKGQGVAILTESV